VKLGGGLLADSRLGAVDQAIAGICRHQTCTVEQTQDERLIVQDYSDAIEALRPPLATQLFAEILLHPNQKLAVC